MTFDEAFQHAQHWAAAWNAHDLDRILSFYADDVVFEVATAVTRWQKPDGKLRGKSELRKHFALGLQIAPQLKFEIETVFLAPSGYAVLYRISDDQRVYQNLRDSIAERLHSMRWRGKQGHRHPTSRSQRRGYRYLDRAAPGWLRLGKGGPLR